MSEASFSRRDFLKAGVVAGAGLTIGFSLQGCRGEGPAFAGNLPFAPDAWVRIGPDGNVFLVVDRSEMGQGVLTALPMILAEELDADWSRVQIVVAPAHPDYGNPELSGAQMTGGSTSVRAAWKELRQAGARARAMLIAAAAERWSVDAATCRTESGVVAHLPSGRRLAYGELAERAGKLPVPDHVPLKDPKDFRLIGRSLPRLDLPRKVTGESRFGIDTRPPGLLIAVINRPPTIGGSVRRFEAASARALPGVRFVVQVPSGIAVVADSYWQARQAAGAVDVEWDDGPNTALDTGEIRRELERLVTSGDSRVARSDGDAKRALAGAARTVEAVYETPYLAHATMEPMNCSADVREDACFIWAPTQFQGGPSVFGGGGARGVAAGITGLPLEDVHVFTTNLGGGFGRRLETDYVAEAVEVSKAVKAPVKVVWSREDDLRHDVYRPATWNRLRAGLDAAGNVTAWSHDFASQSILASWLPGWMPGFVRRLVGPLKGGIDPTNVEGAANLPYAIPNLEVRWTPARLPVPVGFWRGVGNSNNGFITEAFVDEVAAAAGRDPYEFRRMLLAGSPRHLAVLDAAAERAGWGTPPSAGRSRGIAVVESYGSYVAQVAEVSVSAAGRVRVHRVVCAVDCGTVIHPDTVVAQMEGGIVFGLTAALSGAITIEKGQVRQSNFHDYPALRMNEMPTIEVLLLPSGGAPGGVGEVGLPPIAAAVVNAVFRATGRRVRRLPIRAEELKSG